jgi:hypothetical protein
MSFARLRAYSGHDECGIAVTYVWSNSSSYYFEPTVCIYRNAFTTNIITRTKNIHITPQNRNVRRNPALVNEPYFFCKIDATIKKDSAQRKAVKIM